MAKFLITLMLFSTLGVGHAQTTAIFPLAAKRGMRIGAISLNGRYAFLSNASYPSTPIDISIYDVKSRKPIKNVQYRGQVDMQAFGVSDDGRYVQMDDSDGIGYEFLYNVQTDSLVEKRSSSELYKKAIRHHELHRLFFPNDNQHEYYDSWFSHHYAIRTSKSTLHVFDKDQQLNSSYDLTDFEELKNPSKNELSISENGNTLAYNNKSEIFIYDLKSKKKVLHEKLEMKRIDQLSISNDGVVCILGYYREDRDLGLHWYDTNSKKYLYNSTKDGILNLTYVSQFNHHMSFGSGTDEKQKVQQSQFMDLRSGEFSAIIKGKGWSSFNHVQKFVKDTLNRSLLSEEEFDYVNKSKVYLHYSLMKQDYFNKDDEFEPQTTNPQESQQFFDLIDEKEWNIEVLTAHENRVTFQNKTGDLEFFGMYQRKKLVYFWNGEKENPQERLVKLFITEDFKPIFYCDDNYYYCPAGMSDVIGFEQNFKYYPAEQFDLKYNRPDIILDRLGYADSSMISAYHQSYKKRLKKMGFTEDMLKDDFHLPELKIENKKEIPTLHDQDNIELNLHLKDSKYKLDRINIWINDVAIYGMSGISIRNKGVKEYDTLISFPLCKGTNKIEISALNQVGTESYKELAEIECSIGKNKPDLYLISIGESEFEQSKFNLTYAAKDAQDIANLLANSNRYKEVKTKLLVNDQVTKEKVLELKPFLEEADINDQVIVFFAGHGILSSELDYYLATYDIDFSNPELRGLAYEDLEGLLDGITTLNKILILDACHSGEIDKDEVESMTNHVTVSGDVQFRSIGSNLQPKLGSQNAVELSKSLFTDLRKGTGTTVLSSAGGMEFALEGENWKNGLFTYCFINGLSSGKADLNRDGNIKLSELQEYVSEQVYTLSSGKQQPTSRIENQSIDYILW